ncbi:Octanoyltransferase [compost metagenome]
MTYHGFALNVNPELAHLGRLNPCGLDSTAYASMSSLLGRSVGLEEVLLRLLAHLPATLARQPVIPALEA